jgi:hypothetical protein
LNQDRAGEPLQTAIDRGVVFFYRWDTVHVCFTCFCVLTFLSSQRAGKF